MKVFIQSFSDYDLSALEAYLKKILDEIHFWETIKNKRTVLLKPNLLGAYHPDRAVTTHPIVIEAMVKLLQAHEKEVWLGDSPGGSVYVEKIWQETGIFELCKKYDVRLLNFSETGVKEHNSDIGIRTAKAFWEADAVINLPKYKTHSLMLYTGAIKNLYGLIPGLKKSDFHRSHPKTEDFATVLTELYEIAKEKIVLNVLDGIWGMEGEGPSAGIPRKFGVLMVSTSASALDYKAATMMGFKEQQLSYIITGLQNDNLSKESIEVSDKWEKVKFPDVKIKKINLFVKILSHSPRFLQTIFQRFFEYYPAFSSDCKLCMVCKKSCPVQAISYIEAKKEMQIDYKKCIKCMCCHELCPHQAVYIKKSFLAKFLVK